jgi:predicted transcriptional regulator
MSTTIRISAAAHQLLKDEARMTGRSMQAVLEDAVEQFRRQRFIAEVNAGYARVREDEQAWGAVLEEREPWELTTGDGLGDER